MIVKRYAAFLTTFALVLLLAGGVWAQETTPETTSERPSPLSYGTPVEGVITGSAFQQQWSLGTASADRVRVTVTRLNGNLIPDVSILNDSGSVIAQSYGPDQTNASAVIDDFTLPARGSYIVQVGRYDGETGETKGGYSLVVTPLGTAPENPNNQTIVGEMTPETSVSGEITATHWLHRYTYTAQANDVIQVSAERTGGTLLPVINILDGNGNSLTTGYNDYTTASTSAYELPSAGQYTITISRYNDQDGETLGTYNAVLHLIGAGEGSPLLAGAAGTITYDTPLSGEIGAGRWYEDWTYTASAADTISIRVNRNSGDLSPEISLLGGSGQEIRHGYVDLTYASASLDQITLDGAGSYTIRVLRSQDKSGKTNGGYTLTVTLIGTGEENPALTEPVGSITLNQPVQGEITNQKWQNVWTFSGEAGSTIAVTAERTDGTLTPTLEIRDANGQTLTSAYYAATRDSATITYYNVPSSTEYQIVVLRDGGQSGYTAGTYTLTVTTAQ